MTDDSQSPVAAPRGLPAPGRSWHEFFTGRDFGRVPAVWPRPVASPLLTAEESIGVIARACERVAANNGATADVNVRLFRDGAISALAPGVVPRPTDGTPEGYVRRFAALMPGESLGLLLNNYHCLDAELWRRLREFFRAWFEHTGMPAGGATADIFLASYPTTPFGVHQDDQDVFTWVVSGRKRMLVWPPEVFEGVDRRAVDLDDYRARATVLEGEPGDLMFWPSSYWHIGESLGHPVVTLSLGRFTSVVEEVVVEEAKRFLGGTFVLEGLERAADSLRIDRRELQTLPDPLRDATAQLRRGMEDALQRRWLARLSNAGLAPPPARSTPLAASARIAADPIHPVLFAESTGGFIVAGAGRTLFVEAAPWIPALLDALNRGVPTTIDELLDGLYDDALAPQWRARAQETVAELYSFRALFVCE